MTVAAADHAETERVEAFAMSELEPRNQRVARVASESLTRTGPVRGHGVEQLEVGEGIVRRQARVRLRTALDLEDLHQRLVAAPRRGVLGRERSPFEAGRFEHPAAAQVPVVGDREYVHPPKPLFVERLPEIFRILRIERREGKVGDPVRCVDHIAVKHVVVGNGRPLVADEGREATGFVVPLGGGDDLAPGGARDLFEALQVEGLVPRPGVGELRGRSQKELGHSPPASGADRCAQFLRGRGVAAGAVALDPEELRVIGHRAEVERALGANGVAHGVLDRAPFHVRVRVVGQRAHAVREGVEGKRSVHVQVAPEQVPIRVERHLGARGRPFGGFRVERLLDRGVVEPSASDERERETGEQGQAEPGRFGSHPQRLGFTQIAEVTALSWIVAGSGGSTPMVFAA